MRNLRTLVGSLDDFVEDFGVFKPIVNPLVNLRGEEGVSGIAKIEDRLIYI
jgi:hypothetical protein